MSKEKNTAGVNTANNSDKAGLDAGKNVIHPTSQNPKGDDGEDNKPIFTQEQVDKMISERLSRAEQKFEKTLSERLEKERAEAERLAKMSAEEKEKELTQKEAEKLKAKELELTLRENKLAGIEKLNELDMPIKFVEFVISEDTEKMNANIEIMYSEWKKAVEAQVKRQLAGTTPKDPSSEDKGKVYTERKNYF